MRNRVLSKYQSSGNSASIEMIIHQIASIASIPVSSSALEPSPQLCTTHTSFLDSEYKTSKFPPSLPSALSYHILFAEVPLYP